MKFNKKKVLVTSVAIILVAILSFSTLAWFSDADEVTNKFMVAGSEDKNPDEVFSVDVWEKLDKDGDGQPDDEKDHDGNTYENVLPGGTYVKEPHVQNSGAYDQYVRVKVTVSDAAAWMEILGSYSITDLTTIFKGYDDSLWIRLDEPAYDEEADTLTYVYYLEKNLKPGEDVTLFTHVVIPGVLTQNDLAKVGGSFELTIVAEAVQTENVGSNALEAFQTVEASGQEIDQIKP